MLSLLGSALGFAGSALPAVTEIMKNKSNQKFELEKMRVAAELREAINTGMDVSSAIQILWDEDTKAIFAAIVSFWFGSRAIDKARR